MIEYIIARMAEKWGERASLQTVLIVFFVFVAAIAVIGVVLLALTGLLAA